jgi:predicted transcriptional regulator
MQYHDIGPAYLDETAAIVAAYVSQNSLAAGAVASLISSVHTALTGLAEPAPKPLQSPAVPIKKSITPDFLISLEDGKRYKLLKRGLGVHHKLTPEQYRAKWGLPADYPMVAPNYSKRRSELATSFELGKTSKKSAPAITRVAPKANAKAKGKPKVQ